MPKPVLSDSLFNANDVATAILDNAELSVTNQDFAVVNQSSVFSHDSAYTVNEFQAYSFNGFMFVSGQLVYTTTPSSGDTFTTVNNSNYYPVSDAVFPGIGYQQDSVGYLKLSSSTGEFQIYSPTNLGIAPFYISFNGFFRFT